MQPPCPPDEIQKRAALLHAAVSAGQPADQLERELGQAVMPMIYAYPRLAMGAPEEVQAEYLEFALERIMHRQALRRYDSTQTLFTTWFGAVLHRLYLDFLRQKPKEIATIALSDDCGISTTQDERQAILSDKENTEAQAILSALEIRCRILFKLLACESTELSPDELQWLQATTGLPTEELLRRIAHGASCVRNQQADLAEEYDRLQASLWRLRQTEQALRATPQEEHAHRQHLEELTHKRRMAYRQQSDQLSRAGKLPTMPYEDVAAVMNLSAKTVSSQISRCRQAAVARRNACIATESQAQRKSQSMPGQGEPTDDA